jgi:hypothetical protein
MNDGKSKPGPTELEAVIAAGDAWLRKYGVVTSFAHNAIVANLYVAFPKVRYVEYFLPRNPDARRVLVVLYFPTLTLLFSNRDKLVTRVTEFLREYLSGYEITVELRRYKKGVEKSHEIPSNARDLDVSLDADPGRSGEADKAEGEPGDQASDPKADPKS